MNKPEAKQGQSLEEILTSIRRALAEEEVQGGAEAPAAAETSREPVTQPAPGAAVKGDPDVLAPLKLHYLRWVLFDVGSGLHFMYQGIFDTDFDKYLEDAVALFVKTGITTVFTNLEGWPEDWRTNLEAVIKFFRSHQCPSFLEYGEYPYVSAEEVKKALRVKAALATALDQMQ